MNGDKSKVLPNAKPVTGESPKQKTVLGEEIISYCKAKGLSSDDTDELLAIIGKYTSIYSAV